MFPLECGERHVISYIDSCCLQHLIEMNFYAEAQTLSHKFAKLLLKCLNYNYKSNLLNFQALKLDSGRLFLEIMTKYISHFYFLNKFEYSKLLVKIALKAAEETLFKEHPDIMQRRCAIYNNLACIYERCGSYIKAIKYSKFYLKYANGKLDKAVIYNNMAKIQLKIKDHNGSSAAMKNMFLILKEEAKRIWNEHMRNMRETLTSGNNVDTKSKVSLISFLFLNYGSYLQSINKEGESLEVFRKGYEFTLSCLGDFNIMIPKFAAKISSHKEGPRTNIKRQETFFVKPSIDSNCESDLDYLNVMDNNITLKASKQNRNFSEEPYKRHHRMDTFNTFKNVSKKNTLSTLKNSSPNPHNYLNKQSLTNSQNNQNIQNIEMTELKLKMDILLQKFEQIDVEKINKFIEKDSESNSVKANRGKKKKEKIVKIFKPAIKKLVNATTSQVLTNQISIIPNQTMPRRRSTLNVTQDFLDDLVSQFEAEMKEEASVRSGTSGNVSGNVSENDVRQINKSKSSTNVVRNQNGHNPTSYNRNSTKNFVSNNTTNSVIGSELNDSFTSNKNIIIAEKTAKVANARRSLKDVFKKVIPTETLQALEAKQKENELQSRNSIFHQMVNSMMGEDYGPVHKPVDTAKDQDHKTQTTDAKIINNVNLNTSQNVSSNSLNDKEKKVNLPDNKTTPNINIVFDNSEDNYKCETRVIKRTDNLEASPYGKHVSDIAKSFKINIVLDNSSDEYQCKNFFIKRDTQVDNNTIKNTAEIKVVLDEVNNDDYKAETFYIKKQESLNRPELNSITLTNDSKPLVTEINIDSNDDDSYRMNYHRNYLNNKKKKTTDVKKHFDYLIANFRERANAPMFTIIRELNNELYKISISYGHKDKVKGIYLRLVKNDCISENSHASDLTTTSKFSNTLAENFISFEKLKNFSSKITLFNSLPDYLDLHMIDNLDDFIEKIFIYHCYIFTKDESILLGVLTRPLGICFNRAYEFTFLKTTCIIDIFILSTKEVKFYIYNKANDLFSISFNWLIEDECFKSLFCEFEDVLLPFENEKRVQSYRTVDDKHLVKTGFITEIIVGLQKMFRLKTKNENLKFDTLAATFNNGVYNIMIGDNFKKVELLSINYENENESFKVDYFTLKKVLVRNELTTFDYTKALTIEDLSKYLWNLKDVKNLISERDKIHLYFYLLNTYKFDFEMSEKNIKGMKKSEIDSRLQISQKNPEILVNFNFKIDTFVYTLEYVYYSKNNHFFQLNVEDTLISQSYIKILILPYIRNKEKNQIIVQVSSIISKESFKANLLKYCENWKNEEEFIFFDTFEKIGFKS